MKYLQKTLLLYLLLLDKHSGKNLTARRWIASRFPEQSGILEPHFIYFPDCGYNTPLALCPRCICVIARCRAQQISYWTPFTMY